MARDDELLNRSETAFEIANHLRRWADGLEKLAAVEQAHCGGLTFCPNCNPKEYAEQTISEE
jgi:hypothetical protein